jgi:hypothetical protein
MPPPLVVTLAACSIDCTLVDTLTNNTLTHSLTHAAEEERRRKKKKKKKSRPAEQRKCWFVQQRAADRIYYSSNRRASMRLRAVFNSCVDQHANKDNNQRTKRRQEIRVILEMRRAHDQSSPTLQEDTQLSIGEFECMGGDLLRVQCCTVDAQLEGGLVDLLREEDATNEEANVSRGRNEEETTNERDRQRERDRK